jgi:hypothetical protein
MRPARDDGFRQRRLISSLVHRRTGSGWRPRTCLRCSRTWGISRRRRWRSWGNAASSPIARRMRFVSLAVASGLTLGNARRAHSAASWRQHLLGQECSNGFGFVGVYVEEKVQPSDAQDLRDSWVQSGQLDLRIPVASRYQDRTEGTNSATVDLSHLSHLQDNLLSGFEG